MKFSQFPAIAGFGAPHTVDEKQLAIDRIVYAPQPLPHKRSRALTPIFSERAPLTNETEEGEKHVKFPEKPLAQHQHQSSLFSRLPPELRLLIWNRVLGGQWLHLVSAHGRLLAICCAHRREFPDLDTCAHDCWGDTTAGPRTQHFPGFFLRMKRGTPSQPVNLLPLLQTCRLVLVDSFPKKRYSLTQPQIR